MMSFVVLTFMGLACLLTYVTKLNRDLKRKNRTYGKETEKTESADSD